jgi:Tfp pilus assembly protein PilX
MSARRQRGAALFTAVFLIVAIAAIAAMVANIATTQQITSGRSLDATRAYYAARTRLEREIAAVATSTPPGASCPSTGTVSIDGYTTVLEDCEVTGVSEGGDAYDIFILEAAAYRGSRTSGTLVRRELRAVVVNR